MLRRKKMTQKQKRVILGCILLAGVIGSVVLVVMLAGDDQIMSGRQAQRGVEKLKRDIAIPLDQATREKIAGLIEDLARDRDYSMQTEDNKSSVATRASWDLREIGKPVIPQLLDAADSHPNWVVRQFAVSLTFWLAKKTDQTNLMTYLPVFVRGTYDRDVEVRVTATGQIGNMAVWFYRSKREAELKQVIPYLVKALTDKDERAQALAAEILWEVGKSKLVPKELMNKHRIGEGLPPRRLNWAKRVREPNSAEPND
jgi:HEAT repeat protein